MKYFNFGPEVKIHFSLMLSLLSHELLYDRTSEVIQLLLLAKIHRNDCLWKWMQFINCTRSMAHDRFTYFLQGTCWRILQWINTLQFHKFYKCVQINFFLLHVHIYILSVVTRLRRFHFRLYWISVSNFFENILICSRSNANSS